MVRLLLIVMFLQTPLVGLAAMSEVCRHPSHYSHEDLSGHVTLSDHDESDHEHHEDGKEHHCRSSCAVSHHFLAVAPVFELPKHFLSYDFPFVDCRLMSGFVTELIRPPAELLLS